MHSIATTIAMGLSMVVLWQMFMPKVTCAYCGENRGKHDDHCPYKKMEGE